MTLVDEILPDLTWLGLAQLNMGINHIETSFQLKFIRFIALKLKLISFI